MILAFDKAQQRFLDRNRVAHLATSSAKSEPHVVPVCYAFQDQYIVTPIDDKPKKVEATNLKRVRNIRQNDQISFLVDEYSEDWTRLAYLLVQGRAEIITNGPFLQESILLLRRRYEQYQTMALEDHLMLRIIPERVVSWGKVE